MRPNITLDIIYPPGVDLNEAIVNNAVRGLIEILRPLDAPVLRAIIKTVQDYTYQRLIVDYKEKIQGAVDSLYFAEEEVWQGGYVPEDETKWAKYCFSIHPDKDIAKKFEGAAAPFMVGENGSAEPKKETIRVPKDGIFQLLEDMKEELSKKINNKFEEIMKAMEAKIPIEITGRMSQV